MTGIYNNLTFNISKQVTQAYSTSFASAITWLHKDIQGAIYSIYGFVRFADEIVDTFHGFDKENLLKKFEEDYYDAYNKGISLNPILNSFQQAVKQYNIPDDLIQAFFNSMKADLYKTDYTTHKEMEEYIHGSANVVGLMCLKAFVNGDKKRYDELKEGAMSLGSAFQKVNFLRDIKNDVELLNRQYFPEFDKQSLTEEAKQQIVINIEKDFNKALEGIKGLPSNAKLAVYVAYCYYKALLNKLKKTPATKIFTTRIRIPNHRKYLIMLGAYTKVKLGLI